MSASTRTNAEIIASLQEHLTVTAAAEALGINRSTIHDRLRRSPEVAGALLDARESLIDRAEHGLLLRIEQGDFRAIQFVLRTLGRNRGYVERVETRELTDQQLDTELARERARETTMSEPKLLPFPRETPDAPAADDGGLDRS